MKAELNRHVGAAKGDFKTLAKVWRHSSLTRLRKLQILPSLIESRLLYGLPSGCLYVSDARRLDSFQCRCLRQIMNIPPAFISRVSNESVFRSAGHMKASILVQERQLCLLGQILRAPVSNPISYLSFMPGTRQPAVSRYVRRIGRPHLEWVPTVLERAHHIAGNDAHLVQQCQQEGQLEICSLLRFALKECVRGCVFNVR